MTSGTARSQVEMAGLTPFRVGLARTLLQPAARLAFERNGIADAARATGVEWSYLQHDSDVLVADDVRSLDAVIVEGVAVNATSVASCDRLALVARFGAGYDSVDTDACTRAGILVTNAPDGVRRPMATVYLGLLLALSLRIVERDRLTRIGRWAEGAALVGAGLTGRTLGLVGMGNIGTEFLRLAAPLGMRRIVSGPHVEVERAAEFDASVVSLETLLRESDAVCLAVPLTESTRGMIGVRELSVMKPTAWLINASRGAVVDQRALTRALLEHRIGGAALDVFEEEPVPFDDPILELENAIVSPHALASTDECLLLCARSAMSSALALARGEIPEHVVNGEVLDTVAFRRRLARLQVRVTMGDRASSDAEATPRV